MAPKVSIISALINLYQCGNSRISDQTTTHNRINDVGSGLEEFVKNLFFENSDQRKSLSRKRVFFIRGWEK